MSNFWHPCFAISLMITLEAKRQKGGSGPSGEGNSILKGQLQKATVIQKENT
jgi:hypothetical protein